MTPLLVPDNGGSSKIAAGGLLRPASPFVAPSGGTSAHFHFRHLV